MPSARHCHNGSHATDFGVGEGSSIPCGSFDYGHCGNQNALACCMAEWHKADSGCDLSFDDAPHQSVERVGWRDLPMKDSDGEDRWICYRAASITPNKRHLKIREQT
jgi:hypothetical protein